MPLIDEGVVTLKELAKLQTLQLEGTRVTADGIETLRKALPGCHVSHNAGDRPKAGQSDRADENKARHISATVPSAAQETDSKRLPRLRSLSGHQTNVLWLAFLPESKTLISIHGR